MRHLGTRRFLQAAAALIGATLLLSAEAFAQVDTGTIQGTVRDSSGAVMPGVVVTLINVDMGVSFQTKTNDVGNYQFPSIRIGSYTVVEDCNRLSFVRQHTRSVPVMVR